MVSPLRLYPTPHVAAPPSTPPRSSQPVNASGHQSAVLFGKGDKEAQQPQKGSCLSTVLSYLAAPFVALWQGILSLVERFKPQSQKQEQVQPPENEAASAEPASPHQTGFLPAIDPPRSPEEVTQRLNGLADTLPPIKAYCDYLAGEKLLPTGHDPAFMEKIGRHIFELHTLAGDKAKPGESETVSFYRRALTDFYGGDPELQLEATEFLIHHFIDKGLPKAYPDFYRKKNMKPEYDKFQVMAFHMLPQDEMVFKGSWMKSPDFYLKKLQLTLSEDKKAELKKHLPIDNWQEMLAYAAVLSSQWQYRLKMAEELGISPADMGMMGQGHIEEADKVQSALQNFENPNDEKCFEGAQFFAEMICLEMEQFKIMVQDAENAGFFETRDP